MSAYSNAGNDLSIAGGASATIKSRNAKLATCCPCRRKCTCFSTRWRRKTLKDEDDAISPRIGQSWHSKARRRCRQLCYRSTLAALALSGTNPFSQIALPYRRPSCSYLPLPQSEAKRSEPQADAALKPLSIPSWRRQPRPARPGDEYQDAVDRVSDVGQRI